MFRIDAIFLTALGISAVAIALFAITGEQMWLALMLLSYLLRPTLASLGVAKRLIDERQMTIHYRSGNIAFAVMMITAVVVAIARSSAGDPNADYYNIIIIVGIATKAFFNVLLVRDYQKASRTIILAVGVMALLFVVMSHGVSMESLAESVPWLVVIALGVLAKWYARVIGTVVFAVTTVLLVFILSKGFTLGQGATALVICGPLYTAGACLFVRQSDESGEAAVQ